MKAILHKVQTAESLLYAAKLEYCAAAPCYFRTGEMRSRTTSLMQYILIILQKNLRVGE